MRALGQLVVVAGEVACDPPTVVVLHVTGDAGTVERLAVQRARRHAAAGGTMLALEQERTVRIRHGSLLRAGVRGHCYC